MVEIDSDPFAIGAARETATEKEVYIAGDVESELQQVGAVHPNRPVSANDVQAGRLRSIAPTTLIVDPPATGLSAEVRKAILDLSPMTLIYISCNPRH